VIKKEKLNLSGKENVDPLRNQKSQHS